MANQVDDEGGKAVLNEIKAKEEAKIGEEVKEDP